MVPLGFKVVTEMTQCAVTQISIGYQNENIDDCARYFFRSQFKNLHVDVYELSSVDLYTFWFYAVT